MIKIEPIAAFSDNYIWCLYNDDNRQAIVVDPGDAGAVQTALQAKGLTLSAILITHHHPDHTGGIEQLLADQTLPVYGPDSANIPWITHTKKESDTLDVLGLEFETLEIPGHTLDHIAFFCSTLDSGPILFCGDTLFAGGCGRVFEGTPGMMLKSLDKLADLPTSTKIYCAHEYTMGNLAFARAVEPQNTQLADRITQDGDLRAQNTPTVPSTLLTELNTNPFLRCHENSVIASAKEHSASSCDDKVAVFAAIRSWKDNF